MGQRSQCLVVTHRGCVEFCYTLQVNEDIHFLRALKTLETKRSFIDTYHQAGGKGTANTAMAVPVFEGEKWRCLHSNLCVRYRVASPSSSPSLRDLHTFSSFQASKVATREFKFLSFRDIYSDTCARGERTNWGGANMRVMCGSHFWQLGSIASPATKNYRWGDSSSILAQTWPQKRSQSA